MDRPRRLAEFILARRQRIRPEDVGIRSVGLRRVPGLRRDELAKLSGVSTDYLMRLEQGRGHRPSEHVLKALARALRLDDDATAYLYELARLDGQEQQPFPMVEIVRPALQDLLDTWATVPAFIHGRRLDVLASNALARALTPLSEPGTNLLRSWFLDLEERKRYADVDHVLMLAVAYFRASVVNHLDDRHVTELIDELSLHSEDFRRVWARHDVHSALSGEGPLYHHPIVGSLHLRYQTFTVDGTDRQTLFTVSAAPGSPDAQALARLHSWVTASAVPDTAQEQQR